MGTPALLFDDKGEKRYEQQLDIYGGVAAADGWREDMQFRYPGQYEDLETGLRYNRFRYYDAEEGVYLSQDPIGLAGGNPTLYGYVGDVNKEVDFFGLACSHSTKNPKELHAAIDDKWGHTMSPNDMRQVQMTVDRIKSNSPRYSNDGTEFLNSNRIGNPNAQRLNSGNTYTEWTVRTPNVGNNARRRIVVNNQTKEAFYTHDHYDSYVKIDLAGWN